MIIAVKFYITRARSICMPLYLVSRCCSYISSKQYRFLPCDLEVYHRPLSLSHTPPQQSKQCDASGGLAVYRLSFFNKSPIQRDLRGINARFLRTINNAWSPFRPRNTARSAKFWGHLSIERRIMCLLNIKLQSWINWVKLTRSLFFAIFFFFYISTVFDSTVVLFLFDAPFMYRYSSKQREEFASIAKSGSFDLIHEGTQSGRLYIEFSKCVRKLFFYRS